MVFSAGCSAGFLSVWWVFPRELYKLHPPSIPTECGLSKERNFRPISFAKVHKHGFSIPRIKAPDGKFRYAGYHLGVLNTCLDFMAADLSFDVTKGGSVVVSAALIGAAVGALAAGQIADKIGPRRALIINNISLLAGSLLCAFSPGGIWAAVIGVCSAGHHSIPCYIHLKALFVLFHGLKRYSSQLQVEYASNSVLQLKAASLALKSALIKGAQSWVHASTKERF